jgi:hypothetical protein
VIAKTFDSKPLLSVKFHLGNAFTIRINENRYDVALPTAEEARKWRQGMNEEGIHFQM